MTRVIDFTDGFTSATEPSTEGSIASFIESFANDAAYEAKYTAQSGSAYFNTTEGAFKFYDGSTWRTGEKALDNTASVDPTVNDDSDSGYTVYSLWLNDNASPNRIFRCFDATVGAAVWVEVALDSVVDAHIANLNNPHSTDIDHVTPTTTKGDIIVENGSNAIRLGVGANGQVLTADSAEASGLKWATPASAGALSITSQSSNYTAQTTDDVILVDASSGDVTITLYAASGNTGLPLRIKKTDSTTNSVIIDGDGAETIEGFSDINLTAEGSETLIICDGTNWRILEKTVERLFVLDVKSSGTNGGGFTSGSFITRDLNTIKGNAGFLTVASNQMTPLKGRYIFKARVPGYDCDIHRSAFYDATATSFLEYGSSPRCPSNTGVDSFVEARVDVTTSKDYEVRHRCSVTKATNGLGIAASYGVDEVYTSVEVIKEI